MSAKTETIEIPEATANFIRKQDVFKQLYTSLNDFVMDAVRKQLEELMKVGIMK
jgi:hypothetical protein